VASPYEKAVDLALSESKQLVTLSTAILTISISFMKLLPSLSTHSLNILEAAILVSAFSAIAGPAFYGAIRSSLTKTNDTSDETFKSALDQDPVKKRLRLQRILF